MSSSNKRRSPLLTAGQRITAVLAAAALTAGSAVAIAPAAAADYQPTWDSSEEMPVDILARSWLETGLSYFPGETIVANTGLWEKGATLTYAWLLNDNYIRGENGPTLEVRREYTGSVIEFEVTGSMEGRTPVTDRSVPTLPVKESPVQNFTAPTITGDLVPGGILTLDPGTWTEGAKLSVQWLRNGEPSWYYDGNIQHVTGDDLGATFSAVVTADVPWLSPLSASTNISAPVVEAEVAVEGINIPGNVLRAVPGAWAQGKDVYYEWLIDGVSNGYVGQEYNPADDEGGHEISVLANAGNIYATSKPMALQPVIQNYDEPTIEGETVEGRTLTAVPGTWTEGTAFSYQWFRDGVAIPGATGATYRLVSADSGARRMTVDVTGTREGYIPLTRTSTGAGPVTSDYVEIFEDAVMTGEPYLGRTLSVDPGVWTEGTKHTYQWYRIYRYNETPIPGATSSTYKLTREDLDASVRVIVRGTLPDHKAMVSQPGGTRWITVPEVINSKAPAIIGDPVLGDYLYVDPGTWSAGAELSYQWYRDGQGIMYAEANRLLMTDAYIGTQLSVRITATLADHKTTSVYTVPSSAVTAPPVTNTKAPTLTGKAVRGQTLTVSPGIWTDKTSLSYEWLRGDTVINGAKGAAYTLGSDDVGKKITVKVTGSRSLHASLTVSTAPSAAVVNPSLAALPPMISGSTVQGSTLSAVTGAWPAGTSFTYQWMRNGSAIASATGNTYKLVAADTGARMSVKVTGSLAGHLPASAVSVQTGPVTAPAITAPASVSIAGNAFQGQQLKAVPGTWTSGTKIAYQWYANGAAVPAATGSNLLLGPAQTGKKITVKVTGTLDGAAAVSRTSAPTSAVGLYEVKNTSKPALTGSAVVGSTLKAAAGTWTKGAVLSYQWKANGANIAGATGATYKLTDSEFGKTITVTVTGALADHKPASATSAATSKVTRPAVLNTAAPKVTGSPVQGQTLKASAGTWTKGAKLAYQWKANGKDIARATAASYKLTAADFGKTITVAVTGTLSGHTPATAVSAPTAKVTRAAVVNTAKPVISGTMVTGQTLKVSAGTWTKGAKLTYQWKAGGKNIAGATSSSYKMVPADAGKKISVAVTATLVDYTSATVTVEAASAATLPAVANTVKPVITGSAVSGQALKVSAGTWTKGAKLTYQWMRSGQPIKGATKSAYTAAAADAGKRLSVKVTGTLANHKPTSVTTANTAAVKLPAVKVTGTPTISGTAKTGSTLKVSSAGKWTAGSKLSYQWMRNGTVIKGAAAASYKLAAADKGKTITVKVTGSKTGHTPASAVSKKTAAVR